MRDRVADYIFDQIAEARSTIEVPKVEIGESFVTFDVRFKLTIDRAMYDQMDSIGRKQTPMRSVRNMVRRYAKRGFIALMPVPEDADENWVEGV